MKIDHTMPQINVDEVLQNLCAKQKLERDKALSDLITVLSNDDELIIQNFQTSFLSVINDPSSPWESLHGCLLGLKVVVLDSAKDVDARLLMQVREAAFNLLTHLEVRVRQASGEVMGALCNHDQGASFVWCRSRILQLVQSNLEREETSDSSSLAEQENTRKLIEKLNTGSSQQENNSNNALKIFHDTAGWRNLETSMKCLEHMITGSSHHFLPFIDQELLELIFVALNHTNRFVRETGFSVCGALVATGESENAELLEKNPMLIYGDQLSEHLGKGLADNWSQVRLASSVATRKFLMALPEHARERFYPVLLPRICLNRYYVAEGVRIFSQETWRQITGTNGRSLVEKYIENVVSYYVESTKADNHAVREAACACIAELAVKIPQSAVQPQVKVLLQALTTCFTDDSWPVRDAACLACGNFISCFPEESSDSMETLYPFFFANLQDSIPSVRQGAAIALASVVRAYGNDALTPVSSHVSNGLKAVENQPSETEKYGDLDTGVTTYGVAKRLRDNDLNLHSNNQMYSCGSLAPKMGRGGGGCSDCKFRRPPQPWEVCDGSIYLLSELSGIQEACPVITQLLPTVAQAIEHKHYTSHLVLYETVCKVLPNIAKGLGKKSFKSQLHLFIDCLFYSLESENALTSSAASQCLNQLSQFLGPNILRGRVEEHNPTYLRALDANSFITPF